MCCFYRFKEVFITLGPLTYTDADGKTTVYGAVSGPGILENLGQSVAVFSRVAHPDILAWISDSINTFNLSTISTLITNALTTDALTTETFAFTETSTEIVKPEATYQHHQRKLN